MHIVNNIAYADDIQPNDAVSSVRYAGSQTFVITFSSGQSRLFDVTPFLNMPVYAPLRDESVLERVKVDHGALTWLEGSIDIAPETVIAHSYRYSQIA